MAICLSYKQTNRPKYKLLGTFHTSTRDTSHGHAVFNAGLLFCVNISHMVQNQAMMAIVYPSFKAIYAIIGARDLYTVHED